MSPSVKGRSPLVRRSGDFYRWFELIELIDILNWYTDPIKHQAILSEKLIRIVRVLLGFERDDPCDGASETDGVGHGDDQP